ncbi:MAG: amidohydrolase [Clostridiales Family XIII bacterium]|jgi:hypothetical protein|nr:amidohydrolase [Clostridiales Family XIII bacterium]
MGLREKINEIKIIDDHIHALDDVQWITGTGSYPWPQNLGSVQFPNPLTTITQREALFTAYRELYDFHETDMTPENKERINAIYLSTLKDESPVFEKVFKAGNIECAIEVNQDSLELPEKLDPKLYKLSPMVDGLIVPLDNTEYGKTLPNDTARLFLKMYEAFTKNVVGDRKIESFNDYLKFIDTLLADIHARSCACLKMNFGYWRDLAIDVVSKEEAQQIFESNDTTPARYQRLQDYLLRYIIAGTARYEIPTQIHVGGAVPQSMLVSDPVRLDAFLLLPDIQKAKVVLLHGGYPFTRETGFMANRPFAPNIFMDISQYWHLLYGSPQGLVGTLRGWFEMGLAGKMIYGSDGVTPIKILTSAIFFREGLYLALKGMIDDGMISEGQALTMAKMVMRDNAKTLYKI